MSADRLGLYNLALSYVGERSLNSLTEDREPRRLLDTVWNTGNGLIRYAMEQGLWNFAMRAVKVDASSSFTSSFGWAKVFQVPSDLVRLDQISADERFSIPLNAYEMEGDKIFADINPMYLRYVSDDPSFGANFALWPETFTMWVGAYMAVRIGPGLLNDADYKDLIKREHRMLVDARSKSALEAPTRFPPQGKWANARTRGIAGRSDRGNRGQLIG